MSYPTIKLNTGYEMPALGLGYKKKVYIIEHGNLNKEVQKKQL